MVSVVPTRPFTLNHFCTEDSVGSDPIRLTKMARPQSASKIRPYYYYWSVYLALPLAYIVTGRVGLLLAVPPGYATAVFMPAGLAVGSFFLAGSKTLVGTFVGSFFLNIWIGTFSSGQVELARIVGPQ